MQLPKRGELELADGSILRTEHWPKERGVGRLRIERLSATYDVLASNEWDVDPVSTTEFLLYPWRQQSVFVVFALDGMLLVDGQTLAVRTVASEWRVMCVDPSATLRWVWTTSARTDEDWFIEGEPALSNDSVSFVTVRLDKAKAVTLRTRDGLASA
jgi:hypothetical protein